MSIPFPVKLLGGLYSDNTTANVLRFRRYDVSNPFYGAHPDATAAANTSSIQQAINDAYDNGGGTVYLPFVGNGIYKTQTSTDSTTLKYLSAGPVLSSAPASALVSLLLKSNVRLELDDGVVIESQDVNRVVVGMVGMTGGGIEGGWIKSIWDPLNPVSGNSHGIFMYCLTNPNDDPNYDLVFDRLRISNVSSYGIGAQFGFFKNNQYGRLHIHDTGADAIDHKARPKTDGTIPWGNKFHNILTERHGRRVGFTSTCGIDARGPVIVDGFTALEVNFGTSGNVGVRGSAGLYETLAGVDESRVSSYEAIFNNIQVDGGDPNITGGSGIYLLDSGAIVSNAFVRNMDTGVTVSGSGTGWGTNNGSELVNVHVEAAKNIAFYVNSDRVSLMGCEAKGQTEAFESAHGNLAASQTVFVSPRAFNTSNVQVFKNGVQLTVVADYTVTNSTTITLVSGVSGSDYLEIVDPGAVGFDITGSHNKLIGNDSWRMTAARATHGSAGTTLRETGNAWQDEAFVAQYGSGTGTAIVEARTSASGVSVVELELRSLGNSGVVMRANGNRSVRAINPSSAVNWVQVSGSTTGNPVDIAGTGSDTNVGVGFTPKGSGAVTSNAPFQIKSYTVATVPSAAAYPRALIYVSDGTGNKRQAVSDGTNWRWPDGAIVS